MNKSGQAAALALSLLLQAATAVSPALAPPAPPALPAAVPQPAIVLVNAAARTADDLSGTWVYSKDAHRVSFADMNASPPDPRNQRFRDINVQAEERANPNLFFEFDMQRGPTATLPGAWNQPHTELRHCSGLMWYPRTIVPSTAMDANQRAFLRLEAANHHTVVYLNGQRVGEHTGGCTPFSFEVTTLLRPGSNQITLGVDSTRTDEDIPPRLTDWETYGGVTRAVRLVYTPRTRIDDSFVRLNADGSITASVQLNGPQASQPAVKLAICAWGVKTTARTDAQGRAEWTFAAPATLKRWSPEAPQLYDVVLSTAQDSLTDRIGLRTIAVRGQDILLNGQPIFLRGISMHEEECGPAPARIITPQAARALLLEIKQGLNGNYLRLSHDPHSETTVRLADEMGLLAINTYTAWYGDETLADITRITWQDRHGKPMLLSEFGADAKVHFRDPVNRPKFSEDFQAEFYRQTLKMADSIGFLRGMSPWILKDFQSPRREHPVYQQGWDRKGVVSETGERKLAFGVLADYYKNRKAQDTP